jgi:uncharacterized repeat protein (TIGR03803 family)
MFVASWCCRARHLPLARRCRLLLEPLEERLAPATRLSLPTSGYAGDARIGTVMDFPIAINQLQDNDLPTNHVGLAGAQLAVTFPPGVFNFPIGSNRATSNVNLGSVPLSDPVLPGGAPDWTLTANSPADGQLNIQLAAKSGKNITNNNPATGGSLVTIDFPVNSTYNPGSPEVEAIKVVAANGSFQTGVAGNNGAYLLSPAPPYAGNITINPVLTIAPSILSDWTVNLSYNQTLQAVGASGSVTFSATGSLPTGLTLSSGGILSGTPTMTGTYAFTVNATDSAGISAHASFTVTINPAISVDVTTLHNFFGLDGSLPRGDLVLDRTGYLFGTTSFGGQADQGTIFGLYIGSSNVFSDIIDNTTGIEPFGGLVSDDFGNLYGTMSQGGAFDSGSIFTVPKFNLGTIMPFAFFGGPSGRSPYGGLVRDSSGNLFGTTIGGGNFDDGVVFELDGAGTVTGITKTLGTFNGANGKAPTGDLIIDSSGNLFGTTSEGGAFGLGTVFEVFARSTTVTTLASFNGANGGTPYGGLVEDSSGNLFGTTSDGGPGTIFELAKGSGTITTLASFDGGTGGNSPYAGLTLDSSGNLFGTTQYGGTSGHGVVFELPRGSHTIVPLASFNGLNGDQPLAGLVLDSGGNLFGTTWKGGSSDLGTVFEVSPTLPSVTAGNPYTRTLVASGGTGALTFTVPGGSLPQGLMLSSAGVLSGTPTSAGTYNLPVTVTDSVGGSSTAPYTLTVNPGPFSQYVVAAVGSSTIQAGSSFLVTVQTADQYGNPVPNDGGSTSVTATLSPTSTASNFPVTVPLNSSGLGFFLANVQKVGSYTITAASGAFTGSSSPVTVTAGPAAKVSFATQPASTATGLVLPTVTVQVQDWYGNLVTTDNTDAVTISVVGGPGAFTAGSTTTTIAHDGVASFSNLMLVTPGNYTLSAVIPLITPSINSAAFTIAPLQVGTGTFMGTSSGFSLQFNVPYLVNSLTPVLYGNGFGATAPAPSVILTTDPAHLSNTAAYVEGSLILSTATATLTFLATNTALETNYGSPVLPDGIYTAILRSSASTNGFQAANSGGGFLDGLGTGSAGSGDFSASFTVSSAGKDVLWAPATAEGPGQVLNPPGQNQAGGGYPIYLSDSTGAVTDVQVTLTYNPSLLTISGVTGAGLMLLGTSTPGQAMLQYSGPELPAGIQTPIGYLTATVPGGTAANPTPYKAKDLLHLSGVALNGGALPVTTSDALHLVAYVGDGNGDGSYSSDDAVKITRTALQTDTGFAAYPLVDPVIVADTDGSGFLPADAALQVNEAGVGFPTSNLPTPPIPPNVHFQAIGNNVDPSLSLGFRGEGPGARDEGVVTAAVNLDDADPVGSTGLIRGHLALIYDPRRFTATAADVHAGSLLAGGHWEVVPTIDPTTGQIGIALSSDTPIPSAMSGSLVTIDFHSVLNPVAYAPGLPIALVAYASPKGQLVTTELEDAQGMFTLSSLPGSSVYSESFVTGESAWPGLRYSEAPVHGAAPAEHLLSQRAVATPQVVATESTDEEPAGITHAGAITIGSAIGAGPLPLTELAFPLVSMLAIGSESTPGVAVSQFLTDRLLLAFVHMLPGGQLPQQRVESSLARRLQALDNLDVPLWEGSDNAIELLDSGDWFHMISHGLASRVRPPALAPQSPLDRAAMDLVFARTADDAEGTVADD